MSTPAQDRARLLRRARAIRAHVEHARAVAGEREAAKARLSTFLAKYDITPAELDLDSPVPTRNSWSSRTGAGEWPAPSKQREPTVIHLMSGFSESGSTKWRAWCRCGYGTTPRVTQVRAATALYADHPLDSSVCMVCEKDYSGSDWIAIRDRHLLVLTEPSSEDEFVSCRDVLACSARWRVQPESKT